MSRSTNPFSSRKVEGGWQGVLTDEGYVYWRCPHVHATRIEASDCAWKDYRRTTQRIESADRARGLFA